jgi:hypothetical protein
LIPSSTDSSAIKQNDMDQSLLSDSHDTIRQGIRLSFPLGGQDPVQRLLGQFIFPLQSYQQLVS